MANDFQQELKNWFIQLNKHAIYNVKLYKLKKEYKSNFNLKSEIAGNCDFTYISNTKYNKDEEDLDKKFEIIQCDYENVDKNKEDIVKFLEDNGNVRVGNYFKHNGQFDDYFLISSYQEDETYYDICGEGENMYDDCLYVLYYIVRYSSLDKEGYYVLSGMAGGFVKEEFYEKYNIDIWPQPYIL